MTKISKTEFGKLKNGTTVYAFTLSDGRRMATVLDLGATLQALVTPDKNGKPTDVVLGYDTIEEYLENDGYLGATIGRFGNRIAEGRLAVEDKVYALYLNDRDNHLHGGKEGFDKKIWDAQVALENGDEILVLRYVSPDGEEHYPGTLVTTVTYRLTDKGISIDYFATADQKTAINLTNHSYFNLDGDGSADSVSAHYLKIEADEITPTDKNMIPRQGFKKVEGTPFDFTSFKRIGDGNARITEDADMISGNGFDHCYVFRKNRDELVPACVVYSEKSGIEMSVYTDQIAVQLYTANGLSATGKGGRLYGRFGALCLETQAIPNNVNVPEYAALASSLYEAGSAYTHTVRYEFK